MKGYFLCAAKFVVRQRLVLRRRLQAKKIRQGVGQGMTGTVLMLFFGLPSITRSL